ncbi:hypothetical protein [Salinigranum rubrum]|uniref:hypothetical protein n=1 Tax=Salinigranum rubrum TaxID=755307 RepID=UPI001C1F2489|nr:hypothetical protein [Salinigranum rubrum]
MPDGVEPTIVVDLDDETQRRAFRCPRGHANWEPVNHHWWCESCARRWSVDAEFSLLVDHRDRQQYRREEVSLVYGDGEPYKEAASD